jgi:hypothetical protein
LINLERQTSVPQVYAFLGLIATYFFFIFFNIGGQLLTNFAGFVIPGYYSLEALFTANKADDTQWLTVNILDFMVPRMLANTLSPVLGGIRFPVRVRERDQRCLLVPILLHLQVYLRSLAGASNHWVSLPVPSPLHLLIGLSAALKLYSAPLSNPSSPATSPDQAQLRQTFALRSMVLARPCRRDYRIALLFPAKLAELQSILRQTNGIITILR